MNTLINELGTINQEHMELLMEKFNTNPDEAHYSGEPQEYITEYNYYYYDVKNEELTICNTDGDTTHTLDVAYYTEYFVEETA